MSDTRDIVERLRDWRGDPDEVMTEAADEITRLRADLATSMETAAKGIAALSEVVNERAALAQPAAPGWQQPGPVTAEHPLECLIAVEAVRQSDGDWWIGGSTFLPDDAPIAWMPHTAANRAAIDGQRETE